MSKKITYHTTGKGEILFMAAARPLKNLQGNEEFSIKVRLPDSDPTIEHLLSVAEYKVDTKTNRAMEGSGEKIVSFTSKYAPTVFNSENEQLEGREIPYFDGRVDTGQAVITYKVIDFGDKSIVRLQGLKLLDLDLTPRDNEGAKSMSDIFDELKNIK